MRAPVVSVLILILGLTPAAAQRPVVSFQAGASRFEDVHELELGVRFSPRGPFGVDASIDVYPAFLMLGGVAGVADLSIAGAVRFGSGVRLELRAGPSVLGLVGQGGAFAAPGFATGAGIALTLDARTTIRVDYTYRRLLAGDESYPIPSVTAGFLISR